MKDALSVPPTGLYAVGLLSGFGGPSNLAVAPGECIGIFGGPGSGKTMLLRMVAALEPSLGEIWVDGVARSATSPDTWHKIVIYVPELTRPDIKLPPSTTSTFEALDAQLSSGASNEQAALPAMQAKPRVLLLDDPCLQLDAESKERTENLITKWRDSGLAIIVASRDLAWLTRIADRTCRLVDGSLSHDWHP